MKQKFDLLDTESGFVLSIEGQTETLTKDITIVLPDTDNATLATTKEVEDLRTKLVNGAITVRSSDFLGEHAASEFVLKTEAGNLGSNGEIVKFGSFGSEPIAIPAINSFVNFLSLVDNVGNLTGKVDNTKFLLKAAHMYNIRGMISSFDATSGNLQLTYKFYSVATGLEVYTPNVGLYMYNTPTGTAGIRNFEADGFVSPTEDVYLRLKVDANSTTGGSALTTRTTITEYASKDISLANFSINGKKFDVNNNVDLEGLSTLSGYNTTETLTEHRWIDGKPLYRKVITGTIAASPVDVIVNTGLSGISNTGHIINTKIVQSDGLVRSGASSYYISDTNECISYYNQVTGVITIYVSNSNASYANATYQIVLEYTKISDTASSPVRLVGSGNGTAGIVNELPALTGSEGKLLRVNQNGQLEWFDDGFVGCCVNSDSSTTITAGQTGKIKFTSAANCKVYDTHNAYDYVNNKFIAPVSGYYEVIGKTGYNTGGYNRAQIYKNGTNYRIGSDSMSNNSMVTDIIYLNAGDSIELYGFSSVANTTYISGMTYLTISLKK